MLIDELEEMLILAATSPQAQQAIAQAARPATMQAAAWIGGATFLAIVLGVLVVRRL